MVFTDCLSQLVDFVSCVAEKGLGGVQPSTRSYLVYRKEIQLSMTIDIHDMEVKARSAEKFLKNGDKFPAVKLRR